MGLESELSPTQPTDYPLNDGEIATLRPEPKRGITAGTADADPRIMVRMAYTSQTPTASSVPVQVAHQVKVEDRLATHTANVDNTVNPKLVDIEARLDLKIKKMGENTKGALQKIEAEQVALASTMGTLEQTIGLNVSQSIQDAMRPQQESTTALERAMEQLAATSNQTSVTLTQMSQNVNDLAENIRRMDSKRSHPDSSDAQGHKQSRTNSPRSNISTA